MVALELQQIKFNFTKMEEKYPIVGSEEMKAESFNEEEEKIIQRLTEIKLPANRKGHPRFYKLLEEMGDLHSRKNANYTAGQDHFANIRESEKFNIPAWKGTLVRMGDKWNRIISLAKGSPDMVGENIRDTLMDMAVYSLICIILLEEKDNK